MRILLLLVLITATALLACRTDKTNTATATAEKIDLVCETQSEMNNIPTAAVYFLAGDSKVKIASITVLSRSSMLIMTFPPKPWRLWVAGTPEQAITFTLCEKAKR